MPVPEEVVEPAGICSHRDCVAAAQTRCGACHLQFCLAHIDEHMHQDHGLPDC